MNRVSGTAGPPLPTCLMTLLNSGVGLRDRILGATERTVNLYALRVSFV